MDVRLDIGLRPGSATLTIGTLTLRYQQGECVAFNDGTGWTVSDSELFADQPVNRVVFGKQEFRTAMTHVLKRVVVTDHHD